MQSCVIELSKYIYSATKFKGHPPENSVTPVLSADMAALRAVCAKTARQSGRFNHSQSGHDAANTIAQRCSHANGELIKSRSVLIFNKPSS